MHGLTLCIRELQHSFNCSLLRVLETDMCATQGPMKLMHDGYMQYGEVFTVPVLHKNFTFLLGPHVSGHFFKANDDEMSQKEVRQAVCNQSIVLAELSLPCAIIASPQRATGDRSTARCSLTCRSTNSMSRRLAKGWCLMWITR